jgi:dTDP-4-amino-4,6-dideoxygalactose transaminase
MEEGTQLMQRNIQIATPDTGLEEWEAMRESVESGWLTQGPKVAAFERAFAERHGVKHAIATTSCTTALHLMLLGAGIGPGDEVIVPAFTWVATANVVVYCGATPILADVDPATNNITPETIQRALTARTKAIIAVHLFGLCVDIPAIRKVTPDHVMIFEDAACAAGAKLGEMHAGALGLAAAFSFHPRKSITTGEGGMLTTNDDALAARCSMLRNHGASISEEQRHHGPRPYILPDFNLLGFNYRMTDLQGAVGLIQLAKLDRFIAERSYWAAYYDEHFAEVGWIICPQKPTNGQHAWQSYVLYIDPGASSRPPYSRNEIMAKVQDRGISTRPGTHAVHTLGYYCEMLKCRPNDFPGALACQDNTMAIPLHNRMSEDDYAYVADTLLSL